MASLEEFRAQKDAFFKNHPQSPLLAEQKATFSGLRYFPENPDLRLELDVEPFDPQELVMMQTTTGDQRGYIRYGRIFFEVDGEDAVLTVYSDGENFFLPFVDSLANVETYPAGRYLEPQVIGENRLLVDFNLAYNPYCAYNDRWSCPITPFENRLKVPIRAGEKIYQAH
jgi:Uncharacterized conserved protein